MRQALDKQGRGLVLKIFENGKATTVYWEEHKLKATVMLNELQKLASFRKGDLVTYTNTNKSKWSQVEAGDIGIVTRVGKKAVFVYWQKLGKTTNHNLKNCYVKHVRQG